MIVAQKARQGGILTRPETIEERHWNEWFDSGVTEYIIARNIYSVLDSQRLDKLLNYNSKRRWKHSDDIVPAWVVSGIDPITGEATLQGIQAKPDNPTIGLNGKPRKYLGAREYDVAPLFLDVEDKSFWQQTIQDKSTPVIITEGAKKAGCLLSNEYAAISLPGVSTCRKLGRLHEYLKAFCGFGRTFYLCFDSDILIKKPVQQALLDLSRDLAATGSKVMVINLPPQYKGVDDYIVAMGIEAFAKKFNTAQTIEEWKVSLRHRWTERQEGIKEFKRSKLAQRIDLINAAWGGFLEWNELSKSVELNRIPINEQEVKVKIALELDMDVSRDDGIEALRSLAKQNTYHPIREYLQRLPEQFPEPNFDLIDNLATKFFNNPSAIANIYMRKFMVAAVARQMKPGCKVDTAVILHGQQGAKKSSFWDDLFGEDWFSDALGEDSNNKDEILKLHTAWCLEWSEFETVYRKKDVASLKKFMAQKNDTLRVPYDRGVSRHPRTSVLVGTTNDKEILQDPTGDRRFWVIDVLSDNIPVDILPKIRDELWATAYHCWQRGDRWWLSKSEEKLQDETNQDFRVLDPWYERIANFVCDRVQTTIQEIFHELSIEPRQQDIGLSKRVGSILRKLGWDKTRGVGDSRKSRPWVWVNKSKISQEDNSSGSHGSHGSQNPQPSDSNTSTINNCDPYTDVLYGSRGSQNNASIDNDSQECDLLKPCDPLENNLYTSLRGQPDPLPEEDSSGCDPCDPCDPYEVDLNKKLKNIPHPSFNKNKTNTLRIQGITGRWNLDFEFGEKTIHIKLTTPTGKKLSVEDFCHWDWRLTFERFKAVTTREIYRLEKDKLLKDKTFDVKRQKYDDGEFVEFWLSGCKLLKVPSPCGGPFVFQPPEGENFPVHGGLKEFKVSEVNHVGI